MKQTLAAIATTVLLGASSWTVFQTALANPGPELIKTIAPAHRVYHHEHRLWDLGFHKNKQLSAKDAATITKAALILQDKHQLNVSTVATVKSRRGIPMYVVGIANAKNQVVKRVIVDSKSGAIRPLRLKPAVRS